jgi:hypothetical protein
VPPAARPRQVRQPGQEHPGEFALHLEELRVVEPQPGDAVGHPIAQQVDVAAGQVAVEVAQKPGHERQEGLPVVVGAHRGELVRPDARCGQAEHVSAFQRAAHPPLGDHREDPGVDQAGHVAVQAGGGDVRQLSDQGAGGERPVTQEGLDDP